MKFNHAKAVNWLKVISAALPNLSNILKLTTSEVVIIGAGVFDIYSTQNWIPVFKRTTGDLDLSVGLMSGKEDYTVLSEALLESGYAPSDSQRSFRFFSPRKTPGGLTYIDLLAHPMAKNISPGLTQNVMGVGPNFSFEGMEFARLEALQIEEGLFFPNPIAMVGLKRGAYLDEPLLRIKDLADIAELSWGIVEKGTHFEMSDLWGAIKTHPYAKQVRRTLLELGNGDSMFWDLANARQELLKRNFSSSDIDDVIPARLSEWASYLQD